jgi:hypothetical protein
METHEDIVNTELKFLLTLKELAKESLLNASLNSSHFPKGFDISKALQVLDRAIDGEVEFLKEEPEDYLDIYG